MTSFTLIAPEPASLARIEAILIDTRPAADYWAGHLPGALSLPYSEIDADTAAALPEGLIVVYCWGPGCNAAQHGALRFARHGRAVKEMIGGWEYFAREAAADPLVGVS